MNQAISLEFVLSETSEEVLVLVQWAEPEPLSAHSCSVSSSVFGSDKLVDKNRTKP